MNFILSPKYIDFLCCDAACEFLEGTTAAGKTTVGLVKFILRCAQSEKRLHILSGLDLGTIEKNIINKELGVLDVFGDAIRYCPGGLGEHSLPHLKILDKIIYILGYDNKMRWKKALGGQYGCVLIDEINVADIDYVREVSMRCDYLLATLNPDDPDLPIYAEFINHARPLPAWEADTPAPLLRMLSAPPKENWVHWFFSFAHNAALSKEKQARILTMVPEGTKLYQNKILGLRGRSEGLIFNVPDANLLSLAQVRAMQFVRFCAGVDTSYSQKSADTFAFVFLGITQDGRKVALRAKEYSNQHRNIPLTPSDIPPLLVDFLEGCRADFGFARFVYIDCADAATIAECQKYRRQHACLYQFEGAHKRMPVLDRIHLETGWLLHGQSLFLREETAPLLREMNVYCWSEVDNTPQDANDHCINASQYAWLPVRHLLGGWE